MTKDEDEDENEDEDDEVSVYRQTHRTYPLAAFALLRVR
jgi:hypothetical protein